MIHVHLYNWHADDSHLYFYRIHLDLLNRQHNFNLLKSKATWEVKKPRNKTD